MKGRTIIVGTDAASSPIADSEMSRDHKLMTLYPTTYKSSGLNSIVHRRACDSVCVCAVRFLRTVAVDICVTTHLESV